MKTNEWLINRYIMCKTKYTILQFVQKLTGAFLNCCPFVCNSVRCPFVAFWGTLNYLE